MKKTILTSLVILIGISLFSQTNDDEIKTIFNNGRTKHGAYGGLSINYSQIDGKDAFLVGARGAWLIDHSIGIGIAGYGFINDIHTNDGFIDADLDLVGGYGGLLIEPIIMAKSPVHISLPIIIGAGGITYTDNFGWDNNNYDSDAFFVIEPGIEIEFNLIKFMRIATGVYYRHTSNIELEGVDNDVLNGFSTGITLKFGKF